MRKAYFLKTVCPIAACLAALLSASAAQATIADGLVSYWPLDGHLADVADDLAAGEGNDGTLMGTNMNPDFQAGKFNGGIDLDGVDQHIIIDPTSEADYDFLNQDFSISAWFRVDAFAKSWQALVAKGEGNRWRVHRRGTTNELTWNGGNADVPQSNVEINDGEMHHFVGVSKQGVGVEMWMDGVMISTGPAPTNNNNDNAMPVMIGQNPDTGNRTWDGLIDDVGIWGRALTVEEIGMIWSGGAGTSIETLLGGGGFIDGDVNGDMVADTADFLIIRDNFNRSGGVPRAEGDLTFDGRVDLRDFRQWVNATAAPAAVPEPAAATLVLISLALFGARRRRRRTSI